MILVLLFFLFSGVSVSFSALCPSGWEIMEGGRTVCQKIEESRGGYYRYEERFSFQGSPIKGKPMKNRYEIFRGRVQARAGANTSACGLNIFANYMYGIKANIEALKAFIQDWTLSAPALLLYALATYLPVAKEALMGIEMMSNAVARLRGFSCQRAMEMIKQMNYVDSALVQNCVTNKLRERYPDLTDMDYDTLQSVAPEEWWEAYNYCLNEASLVDAVSPKMKQWLENTLNVRQNLWCIFWKDKSSLREVIADLPDAWSEGGLTERAKILAFAMTPGFEFSASGGGTELAKIEVGGWELDADSTTNMKKLLDDMLKKELPSDISLLIDETFNAYTTCIGGGNCDAALSTLEAKIEEFEKKWNVDMDRLLNELELIAKIEALLYKQKEGGDPRAGEALAEFLMVLQSTYSKRIQKQVYLEVRKQILEQFDHAIAYLRLKRNIGDSAGCPSEDTSSGGG